VEYTLGRTIHTLTDGLLKNLFSFVPDISEDSEDPEITARKQKEELLEELLEMDPEDVLERMDDDFLEEEYDDYFLEKAEDLWRILNTRYSEHFEPELVTQLMDLNLHLRDLHNSIRFYKRSRETGQEAASEYYEEKGSSRMVSSAKKTVECLLKLKEMGYSTPPDKT